VESARAVYALAYTVGRDVVFEVGQYAPGAIAGKQLLAHELTHVMQQAGQDQMQSRLAVGPVNDPAEREAEAVSNLISRRQPVEVMGHVATPWLQRQLSRTAPIRTPLEVRPVRTPTESRGAPRRRASTAPTDVPCVTATGPGHFAGASIMFARDSAALSASDEDEIGRYVRDWVARGSRDPIRVDGYASVEGGEAYNFKLSCRRALAVRDELMQLGVPAAMITPVAHGETAEFAARSLAPNRRVIISDGRRMPPGPRQERLPSSCGDIDDFFRTILLVDPGLMSDIATCFCFGASLADLIPQLVPAEIVDCLCNVYLVAQQIYQRGSDGGCWSASNLSVADILAIEALAGLAGIDCATALDAVIGALAGTAAEPGGGTVAGAGLGALGGLILDLAVMAAQNLIIQETLTPLPISQLEACGRLIRTLARRGRRRPVSRTPTPTGPTPPTVPPEQESLERPRPVCGPDVTAQVQSALAFTRSRFRGWNPSEQSQACTALVEPPEAAFAWDIIDLHHNRWILQYRCSPPSSSCPVGTTVPEHPVCATWGAVPPCGSTVEVGNQCYYAGSANYVIFGVMCRLCRDRFGGVEFTETAMRALVDLYKVGGLAGDNVAAAKGWASAGYHNWPSGGTPPPGDKANCSPTCPTRYRGPSFRISWCPHINPWSECTSRLAAIESIAEAVERFVFGGEE
jgi:outer membrane protein OmpA-like peptidoglycan-associated protein